MVKQRWEEKRKEEKGGLKKKRERWEVVTRRTFDYL